MELRLCQTGINLDLANRQRDLIINELIKFGGYTMVSSIGDNILQIPARTKNTDVIMYSSQYWDNFIDNVDQRVQHIIELNNLKYNEEIITYWDYEPPVSDLDNDGAIDDYFMTMKYNPDPQIRLLAANALSEIRYSIMNYGMKYKIGIWSLAKNLSGRVTQDQIDNTNLLMNSSSTDIVLINGYPNINIDDLRWKPTYLSENWSRNVDAWSSKTQGRDIWIAFQSRSKHKHKLDGREVYEAFKFAANDSRVKGVMWWMQAEKESHMDYWQNLNSVCFEPVAKAISGKGY